MSKEERSNSNPVWEWIKKQLKRFFNWLWKQFKKLMGVKVTIKSVLISLVFIAVVIGAVSISCSLNRDEPSLSVTPTVAPTKKPKPTPPKPEVITTSTLKRIIMISELSASKMTYKGITQVMNEENPEEIDFHVMYEATLKAGIEFDKVDFAINHDEKIITAVLPRIMLTNQVVTMSSLKLMFVNKKTDNMMAMNRAYAAAIEDVKKETSQEDAIFGLAKENIEKVLQGLITPIINQTGMEYEVTYRWAD